MALEFGPAFDKVAEQFAAGDDPALRARIGRYAPRGEFKRFMDLPQPPWPEVSAGAPTPYLINPSNGHTRPYPFTPSV